MHSPLGNFVRGRRDATRPDAVGLPAGSRRRAPGLRRSELAALAGISVEYLTRIEQGRDRSPSPAVVNALARALRLDGQEWEHLRYLAKITGGACTAALPQPRHDVRPGVLAVLEQLEPGVAMISNRLGDVLAATQAFDRLARPTGLLDGDAPNLTRFVFTDPRARTVFPDWEQLADERTFELWLGPSAERSAQFRAELAPLAGEEFTRRLRRQHVPARTVLRWVHPVVGEVRFDREVLELPATDAQQLVVFLPADDATTRALDLLRRRSGPATLRAVT
jgi:transcriptional regulator with XRE-family HTH domain